MDLASAVVGGLFGLGGTAMQNAGNWNVMQEQERFQEQMSGTAYQRARADMTAAGLNPLLMAGGGGASTPAGSAIPMQNAVGAGATGAIEAATAKEQIGKLTAERTSAEQIADAQKKALDKLPSLALRAPTYGDLAMSAADAAKSPEMKKALKDSSSVGVPDNKGPDFSTAFQ